MIFCLLPQREYFLFMLIKFSKKGCCRNLFDRLKYHSWKQLELSLVKGSQDVVDLDKSWNWAWQFTLPSKMIFEPKKLNMFKNLKDYPKIFWESKFSQQSTKKLIFVENWNCPEVSSNLSKKYKWLKEFLQTVSAYVIIENFHFWRFRAKEILA